MNHERSLYHNAKSFKACNELWEASELYLHPVHCVLLIFSNIMAVWQSHDDVDTPLLKQKPLS